jgi:predicted metal-dependent hydrolase
MKNYQIDAKLFMRCPLHQGENLQIKIDEIIRTRRKTIALEITPDAKLIVRTPLSIKNDYIRKLVEQKRSWIRKKQLEIARRNETCLRNHCLDGESLMFLGDSYRIEYSGPAQAQSVSIKNGTAIFSAGRKYEAIDLIREWYIKEAQRIFEGRTKYWAAVSGIVHKSVRASKTAKRWGSCGIKGTLNLSFCLIMAPLRCRTRAGPRRIQESFQRILGQGEGDHAGL